jgi:hypothetical protein
MLNAISEAMAGFFQDNDRAKCRYGVDSPAECKQFKPFNIQVNQVTARKTEIVNHERRGPSFAVYIRRPCVVVYLPT